MNVCRPRLDAVQDALICDLRGIIIIDAATHSSLSDGKTQEEIKRAMN